MSLLALQTNGKILVGGSFTNLAGQPRNLIGRLNNTDPATQSLTCNSSTVTWLRGGTSPEAWRTTFDYSTNGVAWTSLGAGSRIPSGWQLGGLSLPAGGTIRARGYVTGGQYNGSGWFVETLLNLETGPSQRPGLAIAFTGATPALQVTGTVGAPYTIEYTPTLPATSNWLTVPSFVLSNSPQTILDTTFTGEAQRFYRVRTGP